MELKCDEHNFDMNGTLITPNKDLDFSQTFDTIAMVYCLARKMELKWYTMSLW